MPVGTANFDALYKCHAPGVFRRARRLMGNAADAHEIVQDVFLSLFERPDQYGGRSALTTFLYSATTHACLNRIRNRKNRLRLLEENLAVEPTTEATQLSPEQLSLVHRTLESMPEDLAQVAVYHCVDDLSHDDIARILGCSRRHVGNLLERVAEWGRAQEQTPC